MRFISKRRPRIVILIIGLAALISVTARIIIQFQLGQEIEHYRTFFKNHKDSLHDIYDPLSIKQIPFETINALYETRMADGAGSQQKAIQWDNYAYLSYATELEYLCNTLILFKRLKQFGTNAKLVALVSRDLVESENSAKQQNTRALMDKLTEIAPEQVVVKLVDSIVKSGDPTPWSKSLTKLHIFNQTEYGRVIYLDSDAAVSNNMDELFFLPPYVRFAAPLMYWSLSETDLQTACKEVRVSEKKAVKLDNIVKTLNQRVRKQQPIYNHLPGLPNSLCFHSSNVAKEILDTRRSMSPLLHFGRGEERAKIEFSSNLMVINPNSRTFESIVQNLLPKVMNQKGQFDTDLINAELYNLKQVIHAQFMLFRKLKTAFIPEVMVLPFAEYGLLTGSICNEKHQKLIKNEILGYEAMQTAETETLESLVAKSKYIHYSDFSISKPWFYADFDQLECHPGGDDPNEAETCKIWNSVYQGFWQAKQICELK
ncbi:LAME_0D09560g1_1 [Lachancea meyersii CBS 8951]|uniref:LAME_0D09560g1_1 n=1 Tax=Lachancea meyersii CBS 8951 TaxID=1266667 RepID=A0A1G4JB84_9SACH|nr:LAME_0D09560g1_1 [Lachancea meyersii CBS 8951]